MKGWGFALVFLHFGNDLSSDRELCVLVCRLAVQTAVRVLEFA